MIVHIQIQVRGIVQGVGFRPFVYVLALRHQLSGVVQNNETGVLIEVEGESAAVEKFLSELQTKTPPLARIEALEVFAKPELAHYEDFRIVASTGVGPKVVPVSPDVATCDDCLHEMFDEANRRFRYPFINCTNCGPRFTIIEDVPYDRTQTTMREFVMCDECRAEYENPLDRRFHAEPIACARCGPSLSLVAGADRSEAGIEPHDLTGDAALTEAVNLLRAGKILAIKGIGGYHLACNALNSEPVAELRRRKYREDKPFALMARDLEMIHRFCMVDDNGVTALTSAARPIVLLPARDHVEIPEAVAPRLKSLGFMLPYAPLHHLLLKECTGPLVMTSANISDEPICYEDDDAHRRLAKIADYFLVHNRRIHMRMDDSVVRTIGHDDRPALLRRSRGYAPVPLRTVGSSRVDLQACKLEYSIVSPK